MNAIKFQTTVDDEVAGVLPALKPLLGHRVEVIALDHVPPRAEKTSISLDDFLSKRLKRPADVEPVTLGDMEQAVVRGALDGNV